MGTKIKATPYSLVHVRKMNHEETTEKSFKVFITMDVIVYSYDS